MPLIVLLFFLFLLSSQSVYANGEYFRTLRNDKVNLRQGPSFNYSIKIFYKKKFLPVLIQDRSDNFRKIRDHENNTGWVHISQLSKKKGGNHN
jgi:SH3-like domain-containing protein